MAMKDNVVGLPPKIVSDGAGGADDYSICDRQFMDDVTQLKALRSYIIRHAKSTEAGTIELGGLNLLRFDKKGRLPTSDEWTDLERRNNNLYQHLTELTEPDRRRFLYGQIPYFVFTTAGVLGLVAFGSLVIAFAGSLLMTFWFKPPAEHLTAAGLFMITIFVAFLAWAAALGGVGSIAFIGMNAIAALEDATFDITNRKLIGLRVLLGALFGVVLTLPFGFLPFTKFIASLYGPAGAPPGTGTPATSEPTSALALGSVLLLLPFVLGFSTTLVIMILNQFVEAVQTFFGKRSSPPPVAPPRAAARAHPTAEGTPTR
jgi:hypothetical protein